MQNAVVAEELTKRFDDFTAVDAITFEVEPGETFALLGPNGAGKTSTMRMVATVSRPTSGALSVLDRDATTEGREIRSRLGVVPQEDHLDIELTVRENLMVYGRYFGKSWNDARARADELLSFAQLTERGDSRVEPLSGGMKRRLTIARALVNDPELVLLDEPTTGLDPQARHLLWDRLRLLKERGVTQLLTTHYMDEAEQLADRLVIMDNGVIVAEGSPAELIRRSTSREVVEIHTDAVVPTDLGAGIRVEPLRDRTLLYADDGVAALRALQLRGLEPSSTMIRRSTLEDVFLQITGRQLVD